MRVAIVGAGIIGCAIARELTTRGVSVVLIDGRAPSLGASQASAGVLAPYIEGHDRGLLMTLGLRSLALFDRFVQDVRADAGVDFEYARCGTIEIATDDDGAARLGAAATVLRAGGVEHDLLDGRGALDAETHLTTATTAALIIHQHAFVAAGALTAALARATASRGAQVLAGRRVQRLRVDAHAIIVETDGEPIAVDRAVLAAGSWSGSVPIDGEHPIPVRPVRGQLVYLAWPDKRLTRIVWGPRCYLVPWRDGSLLVGATVEEAGFDERATAAGVHDLIEAACDIVPEAWNAAFREVRVGLRPGTPDDLPVIGRSRRVSGLFYATGHYRNGVLLAPLTAELVADLVVETKEDPVLAALSPARFE